MSQPAATALRKAMGDVDVLYDIINDSDIYLFTFLSHLALQ